MKLREAANQMLFEVGHVKWYVSDKFPKKWTRGDGQVYWDAYVDIQPFRSGTKTQHTQIIKFLETNGRKILLESKCSPSVCEVAYIYKSVVYVQDGWNFDVYTKSRLKGLLKPYK